MDTFLKHLYRARFFLLSIGYIGFYVTFFPVKGPILNYIGKFFALVALLLIILEIGRAAYNTFKADR